MINTLSRGLIYLYYIGTRHTHSFNKIYNARAVQGALVFLVPNAHAGKNTESSIKRYQCSDTAMIRKLKSTREWIMKSGIRWLNFCTMIIFLTYNSFKTRGDVLISCLDLCQGDMPSLKSKTLLDDTPALLRSV